MAQNTITNLHKTLAGLQENSFIQGIRARIQEFSTNIPDLMGRVDTSGHFQRIRNRVIKRLDKKRSKFKLALESLGWGTLMDMLESAFNGDKLDMWI